MATKVLVVENDRAVAELVEIVLRIEGYDVELAPEHQFALDRVGATRPDLVVVDCSDPRGYGRGWDLALALQRLDRRIPLVMLTSDVNDALEVGVTERGKLFFGAVTMPFDIDKFLSAVGSAAHPQARTSAALVSPLGSQLVMSPTYWEPHQFSIPA